LSGDEKLRDTEKEIVPTITEFLWSVWKKLCKSSCLSETVSFRSLIRILESCYRLKIDAKSRDIRDEAYWILAAKVSVGGLFKDTSKLEQFLQELHQEFDVSEAEINSIVEEPNDKSGKLVLVGRRLQYAKNVTCAIKCGFPVLLEGPAAVGKTAMITMLAENWKEQGKLDRRDLERVIKFTLLFPIFSQHCYHCSFTNCSRAF
jgi:hypothetical protein